MASAAPRTATLYRMVMDTHVCPYGLKARDLLRRQGYAVEDHALRTREETDAFKAKYGVKTTPQVFIGGERVGGYDDLRRFFGKRVADPKATTYRPVVALFVMTALMALAASQAVYANPFTLRAAEWFVAFSMAVLALLKLQNVESFATMFLNYDLLAKRWVPYWGRHIKRAQIYGNGDHAGSRTV
jgi:glutaredoxin-related protein